MKNHWSLVSLQTLISLNTLGWNFNVHFLNLPQYGVINKQMIPGYLPSIPGVESFWCISKC